MTRVLPRPMRRASQACGVIALRCTVIVIDAWAATLERVAFARDGRTARWTRRFQDRPA